MKEYKFYVNLCGGYASGEITVKAKNEGLSYEKAMYKVGTKLIKAFPELDIEYNVEFAEDYEE